MTTPLHRLRDLRRTMARFLFIASTVSIISGVFMWIGGNDYWKSLASQFVIWGLIDIVFAMLGVRQYLRADRTPESETASREEFAEAGSLLKSLRFNNGLNLVWVSTGFVLLVWGSVVMSAGLLGHATGVLFQGGLLMWLDLTFAGRLSVISSKQSESTES